MLILDLPVFQYLGSLIDSSIMKCEYELTNSQCTGRIQDIEKRGTNWHV